MLWSLVDALHQVEQSAQLANHSEEVEGVAMEKGLADAHSNAMAKVNIDLASE